MRIIPWKQSREDCSRQERSVIFAIGAFVGEPARLLRSSARVCAASDRAEAGAENGTVQPSVEQLQYLSSGRGQPLFRCSCSGSEGSGRLRRCRELGSSELLSELELSGVLLELPLLSEALPEEWEGWYGG